MNLGAINSLTSGKNAVVGGKPSVPGDSFAPATDLEGALQNTPDVRADAVERGRNLVNDDGYPPDGAIKSLSNFLAGHLSNGLDDNQS